MRTQPVSHDTRQRRYEAARLLAQAAALLADDPEPALQAIAVEAEAQRGEALQAAWQVASA